MKHIPALTCDKAIEYMREKKHDHKIAVLNKNDPSFYMNQNGVKIKMILYFDGQSIRSLSISDTDHFIQPEDIKDKGYTFTYLRQEG